MELKRNWLQTVLIYTVHLFFFPFLGSNGDIVITQTPSSAAVLPGETVTIQCRTSGFASNEMNLYRLQHGQKPKLLLYLVSSRFGNTPARFSGRYSGNDYTFTISGVEAGDAGEYYCGHDYGVPLTVIQSITKTLSVAQSS